VAGVNLSYDAALIAGLNTRGVSGSLNTSAGLLKLLEGSGIEALAQPGGGYSLRKSAQATPLPAAASAGDATLPVVRVTAMAERDGTTEGSGSYRATHTNTATKLNLTPRETPQTVTVITRQQMDDFGMTSVDDALRSASGIFVADRGNNGSDYFSRGFPLQSQYDGVANPIGISESNKNPQIENAFLDRVEILQGASGLLAGAGYPGGTINLVRKRPTTDFQASAEVQLASWNGRRAVGDVSGPLDESGHIRGRVVAVADNSDSFVDYVYRNRRAVYGVLEADLTSTTTLSASVQYQQDKGRNQFGVPFAANGSESGLSRSSFFGDAQSHTTKDSTLYTMGLTQRLENDWLAKATFIRGKTDSNISRVSFIWGDLNLTTGDGMTMYRQRSLTSQIDSNALDFYASGPFQLFGRKHELAFGANGSSMKESYYGSGYTAVDAINVYTFNPSTLSDVAASGGYSGDSKVTQLGVYGVARFNLTDALKLITGARVSNYKDQDELTGTTNAEKNGVISPYAGLVYDLNSQYSAYISYSDIFNPQTYKNGTGGALKPVVGSNYEVGIKGELLNKRLNVAAAVFRLEQTNLPRLDESTAYDPSNTCGGYCYIAANKVLSQGFDLSANGEIQPGWNIAAGYTYVNSKYASSANDGEPYKTETPRSNLRFSTAYKLPGTDWTLGGNVSMRSKTYLDGVNGSGEAYKIRSGGLALVGLMAKYQINSKTETVLTVSNLFDRTYRTFLEGKNYSSFGEPRKFSVNLKYHF
jgi:outer membrane receptor for ferric coprogen and ferric-rhodotorulic acid